MTRVTTMSHAPVLSGLLLLVAACDGLGVLGDHSGTLDSALASPTTCSVAPNPAYVEADFVVLATGFEKEVALRLEITSASGTVNLAGVTSSSGELSTVARSSAPGPGEVKVYLREELSTTCSFEVIASGCDPVCPDAAVPPDAPAGCEAACEAEGTTTCTDSELRTCLLGTSGCLEWSEPASCAGGCGDELTCAEIDECSLGTDNCHANATCTDTPGAFTCACNPGWTGDGVTCTEVAFNPVYVGDFPAVAGSVTSYTGSMSAGSRLLTLNTAAHDLAVGHGVAVKGAGTYGEGWLRTRVTAVAGAQLTLAATANASVSGVRVDHDDSEALQEIIDGLADGSTLVVNVASMNLGAVNLRSNMVYDGAGCVVYTPLYFAQAPPDRIHVVLNGRDLSNIVIENFEMDGGKNRGVYGNDQFGAALVSIENLADSAIRNNYLRDNYYVGLRLLGRQHNVVVDANQIDNTDVAVIFMPIWYSWADFFNLDITNNRITAIDCNSEAIGVLPSYFDWRDHATGQIRASSVDINISGNTINKPGRVAVVYGGISEQVLIENNDFVASMTAISNYDKGGELLVNGTSTPALNTSRNVVIRNNVIRDTLYEAMWLGGSDVVLEGNQFVGTIGGIAPYVAQDAHGTQGNIQIRNHVFALGSKTLVFTQDRPLNGLHFHSNQITASNGTNVLQIRAGTGIVVDNNTGATNANVVVPAGSTVAPGQFNQVSYQ